MIVYIITMFLIITLLFYSCKICKSVYNEKYLNLNQTISLKGIAAIGIMFHHLSQCIQFPVISLIWRGISGQFVAIFLFLSGYGLTYNFYNKEKYLQNFHNRLLFVMIPYWIINFLLLIYYFIMKIPVNFICWLASLIGINRLVPSFMGINIDPIKATFWFITTIICMYLLFFYHLIILKKTVNLF